MSRMSDMAQTIEGLRSAAAAISDAADWLTKVFSSEPQAEDAPASPSEPELTLEQVSVCMGIPARYVRKRYPEGWSNMAGQEGSGRGNTIRLDTLLDQEFGTY